MAGDEENARRRYTEAFFAWQIRGLDDLIAQHIAPRLAQARGSAEAAEAYLAQLAADQERPPP